MPEVSRDEAIDLLAKAIANGFAVDELLEIHDDLFPDNPYPEGNARKDPLPLIKQLTEYVHSGLAIDELVALWNLVFTHHRDVWYNEEEDSIHYSDEAEAFSRE